MSGATLFMLVLLLVLLALLLGALGWWWRTRGGTEIRSFYAAVRQMEREQGWQGRYEAPWLLMLGNETEGEQLCATWRLLPVARPAWFGRWWSDGEGRSCWCPSRCSCPTRACAGKAAPGCACCVCSCACAAGARWTEWSGTFRWRGCRMASRRPTSASPPVVATWN